MITDLAMARMKKYLDDQKPTTIAAVVVTLNSDGVPSMMFDGNIGHMTHMAMAFNALVNKMVLGEIPPLLEQQQGKPT